MFYQAIKLGHAVTYGSSVCICICFIKASFTQTHILSHRTPDRYLSSHSWHLISHGRCFVVLTVHSLIHLWDVITVTFPLEGSNSFCGLNQSYEKTVKTLSSHKVFDVQLGFSFSHFILVLWFNLMLMTTQLAPPSFR